MIVVKAAIGPTSWARPSTIHAWTPVTARSTTSRTAGGAPRSVRNDDRAATPFWFAWMSATIDGMNTAMITNRAMTTITIARKHAAAAARARGQPRRTWSETTIG